MPLDFLCRQFENTVDFPCFQTQSIGLILIWLNKNPVVSSVFQAVFSLQNAKIWIDNIIFYTLKFLDYADCLQLKQRNINKFSEISVLYFKRHEKCQTDIGLIFSMPTKHRKVVKAAGLAGISHERSRLWQYPYQCQKT